MHAWLHCKFSWKVGPQTFNQVMSEDPIRTGWGGGGGGDFEACWYETQCGVANCTFHVVFLLPSLGEYHELLNKINSFRILCRISLTVANSVSQKVHE